MPENKDLSDHELDTVQGALSSDPEWKYVPVRRTALTVEENMHNPRGSFTLPEVDDEVIVG